MGGAVRDLMLGRQPKDFDVATDAHPEEIRELFRNCRLIGRRFRLAHIRFGREIIEVATFRSGDSDDASATEQHTDSTGRIVRDNVYGDIGDDVWRRDFTANALYYNIADFSIWDYVDGVKDIQSKTLRLLGEPTERYREDPVRMLRAVRFAAKLDFKIHEDTERPLAKLAPLLENVPPARLYDECAKLFLHGHAERTLELLRRYRLFGFLFDGTDQFLNERAGSPEGEQAQELLMAATRNTDDRVAQGKPVTSAFLISVFLWPLVRERAESLRKSGSGPIQSVVMACEQVVGAQQQVVAIPKRIVLPVRETLVMQYRLRNRRGIRAVRLLEHPRFRAAYDLLLLRAGINEEPEELLDWWTAFQEMSPTQQLEAANVSPKAGTGNKKKSGSKRRRRRRPKAD